MSTNSPPTVWQQIIRRISNKKKQKTLTPTDYQFEWHDTIR